ncbi:hypothetical protein IG631_06874 [Alternaria alternata]|nr:hypothetical protein IG631_06874 [Alternaria alternata]
MLSNQLAYSVLPVCTTFDVLEASVYNVRTFDPDNYVPPIDEASSPFLYVESSQPISTCRPACNTIRYRKFPDVLIQVTICFGQTVGLV